jgi:hypothetical protein
MVDAGTYRLCLITIGPTAASAEQQSARTSAGKRTLKFEARRLSA